MTEVPSKANPNVDFEADIDLDAIVAQRTEARGEGKLYDFDWTITEEDGSTDISTYHKSEGEVFSFSFQGRRWVARDPQFLLDAEKEELDPITFDTDVSMWYMGETQYDEFLQAGGESWMFLQAFTKYQKKIQAEVNGNPTQQSRSSRRRPKRSRQR